MDWKPKGYTSVSPYLLVRDAEKTLAFLEAVFGAKRLRIHPNDSGTGIKHAEVRLDDSVIMMGEVRDAPDANVHVYVADVEAAFARAKAEGGHVVQELMRQGDGDYRGGIADGNGAVWWMAQQEEEIGFVTA